MREVYEFIQRTKVFHFATVDAQQRPRVRPFGTCVQIGDRLHFVTHTSKPVYEQLLANPWVEIEAYDAEPKQWLRLSGRVVWDDDPAIADAMEADAKTRGKKPPVGDEVYFHLEDAEAQFCTMGGLVSAFSF